MELALLVLRLVVGLIFVAHAGLKLFCVWGGSGIRGTADAFDQIGLHPSKVHARLAALSELGGGVLIALGLVTPIAAAALIAVRDLEAGWAASPDASASSVPVSSLGLNGLSTTQPPRRPG